MKIIQRKLTWRTCRSWPRSPAPAPASSCPRPVGAAPFSLFFVCFSSFCYKIQVSTFISQTSRRGCYLPASISRSTCSLISWNVDIFNISLHRSHLKKHEFAILRLSIKCAKIAILNSSINGVKRPKPAPFLVMNYTNSQMQGLELGKKWKRGKKKGGKLHLKKRKKGPQKSSFVGYKLQKCSQGWQRKT